MLKKEEFSIILESKLIIYPHKGWSKSTLGTFGFCQKNPSDTLPPFMMVSGPKVPAPPPPELASFFLSNNKVFPCKF